MNILLRRIESGDHGTFGLLSWDGMVGLPLVSGELPWRNNKANFSCIPAGDYQIAQIFSPHFKKNVYQVLNVLNRDAVEIHPANWCGDVTKGWKTDLLGCLSMGLDIQVMPNGQFGLQSSTVAIQKFESALNGQPATLVITDVSPLSEVAA